MAITEIETSDTVKIIEVEGSHLMIQLCEMDFNINVYEAEWNDEFEEYEEGEKVGSINLKELDDGNFYITWMGFEGCGRKYLHKGIGRLGLKFFKNYFGGKIFAADNDEHTRSDGSHLTNDAPIFIGKMMEEGIVESPDSPEVN